MVVWGLSTSWTFEGEATGRHGENGCSEGIAMARNTVSRNFHLIAGLHYLLGVGRGDFCRIFVFSLHYQLKKV